VAQTHVGDAVGTPPEDADQRPLRTADTGTRFSKHIHISHQLIIPPPDCQSAAERTPSSTVLPDLLRPGRLVSVATDRPSELEIRRALAECTTLGDIDDAMGWSPGTARRRRWRPLERGGLPSADAELGGVALWFRSTFES
jgi:hypothetical protein